MVLASAETLLRLTMFGLLRSSRHDVTYRQIYARHCQAARRFGGLWSLPLLSFEAVFLQSVLTDMGYCEAPPADAPKCCRLRPRTTSVSHQTDSIEAFCAAFGLLLVGVKLDDDIADEGSWKARLLKWKLSVPLTKSRALFDSYDADFQTRLNGHLAHHAACETSESVPPWNQYMTSTANAFGDVFALASRCCPESQRAVDESWLRHLGQHIGAAILAFDCAADWESDQRLRRFNPLKSQAEAEDMLLQAQWYLVQAAWHLDERFPSDSGSSPLATRLSQRIARTTYEQLRNYSLPWQRRAARRDRWERWGLWREPGYTYAKCDCACDGLCAGLECIGGCGEGAGACGECAACGEGSGACASCGDGILCCDCFSGGCGDSSKSKKKPSAQSDSDDSDSSKLTALIGKTGTTKTQLSPSGIVEIDGQTYATQSELNFIESGTPVVVISTNSTWLVVR